MRAPTSLLFWARATTEAKGYGAAGTSLITVLTKLIPDFTKYPVNYPADWLGCNSETKGVNDILQHIVTMSKACPKQRYVLGGYSQGGVVVTHTILKIPSELRSKILAVTMFDAPPCPSEVKNNCKSYCNAGDDICAGTTNPKADGFCKGAQGAQLWVAPPIRNETAEAEVLAMVQSLFLETSESGGEFGAAEEYSNADVPEKGRKVNGFAKSYNADAFYTKAAAYYIYKKLKSSGS